MNIQQLIKNVGSGLKKLGSDFLDAYNQRMDAPTACCSCQQIFRYQDLLPTLSASWSEIKNLSLYHQVWKQPWPGEKPHPHSYCPTCWEPIRQEYKKILEATRQEQAKQERLAVNHRRESAAVKRHNERALLAGCEATLTIGQWIETLEHYNWQCAYCGKPYQELEHEIPIVHGGGTTAMNCLPSCRPCNRQKGGKHPDSIGETSLSPEAHRRIRAEMKALHGGKLQKSLSEKSAPFSPDVTDN